MPNAPKFLLADPIGKMENTTTILPKMVYCYGKTCYDAGGKFNWVASLSGYRAGVSLSM